MSNNVVSHHAPDQSWKRPFKPRVGIAFPAFLRIGALAWPWELLDHESSRSIRDAEAIPRSALRADLLPLYEEVHACGGRAQLNRGAFSLALLAGPGSGSLASVMRRTAPTPLLCLIPAEYGMRPHLPKNRTRDGWTA